MRDRLTPDVEQYARITRLALVAFTLIVLTGAAVRVTGSGLGCPTWPKCTNDALYTQLKLHGVIEFGNRVLTSVVTLAALAALVGAIRRKPYRKDLVVLAAMLPLGVVAQIVLGGFTVLYKLAPGFVMSHFLLSMLILVACVTLDWRAHHERGEQSATVTPADRTLVRGAWALLPLGTLTIFAGTAATAAGPLAGGAGTGNVIKRLHFKGADTLHFIVEQHARLATLLGLAAVALWFVARRRGIGAAERTPLTALCVLLALQGAVGALQYALHLPAEIVWVHVTLAAATWVALLWTVAAARRFEARPAHARGTHGEAAPAR
ncbi:MAG TPA: COX15/CtaA family protein [Solirubrobacteraceae bacterium]|jgi:cytochrome c oxidase assembly protein subunit 15|nr:COX15/CtaA family protein [Solirubrobacteraceae bacterium]